MAKRVPCPRVNRISTRPPRAATSLRTTSMPTPRPATCETSSAVEKPAWKLKSAISDSERPACGCIRPFPIAFGQILLQVAVQPRLGEQGFLRFVDRIDEVAVHRRYVADALRHEPRHFLEAGEAVEFERVEIALCLLGELKARLHLRLRLDLDLAKL